MNHYTHDPVLIVLAILMAVTGLSALIAHVRVKRAERWLLKNGLQLSSYLFHLNRKRTWKH